MEKLILYKFLEDDIRRGMTECSPKIRPFYEVYSLKEELKLFLWIVEFSPEEWCRKRVLMDLS